MFNEMGAPRIITTNAQLKEYVIALLELDRRSQLTASEENLAELLILLIEAYVKNRHPLRSGSDLQILKELLPASELWQKN